MLKISFKCLTEVREGVRPIDSIIERANCNYSSVTEELLRTGVCFPGRKAIRIVCGSLCNHPPSLRCFKFYLNNRRTGAGVCCFWCADHSVALGFVVLPKSESLEIVYNTLVTRFPVMPQIIIYDNGCNLSEYCLNRSPQLFADTIFLVDAFHYAGHTNCSASFNSKRSGIMDDLSSVLHEHKNATLAKSKIPAMYMRYDTFVFMFKVMISSMNNAAMKKNRGERIVEKEFV